MFDIAWSELALIGAVALIVIGPKDLPKVMRTMGVWMRRARLMASEFQRNFDDMLREAELDELKREVESVSPSAMKEKLEEMMDVTAIRESMRIEPEPRPSAEPEIDTTATPAPTPVPHEVPHIEPKA